MASLEHPARPAPDLYRQTIVAIAPGGLLCRRYGLEAQIGAGGMGQVWRARDRRLDDRLVALKMLPAAANRDRRAVEQLKTEALRHIDLRHDHIVGLYDFEIDDARGGLAFLVMQYIAGADGVSPGPTLADRIRESGPQSIETMRQWAEPIAAAIDHAHRKRVLHRDIKPQNILFAGDGSPALADFGIACELRTTVIRVTGRTDSSGTPLYMSPQQRRGIAHASNDVYSLAATVYEALAGRPVIDPAGDVYFQIMSDEPPPLIPGVTEAVNEAVRGGLAKGIDDRPATCRALIEAIERAAAGGSSRPGGSPAAVVVGTSAGGRGTTSPTRSACQPGDVLTLLLGKRGEREVEFRFRWIPPGSLMQGSPADEEGHSSDEGPQRRVTFGRGFWLLETPVTQAQWKAVMGRGNNPSWYSKADDADRRPVETVSWEDCQSFLREANDQDAMRQAQRRLRLPGESEWEYACRAGTTTPFHFGQTISTDQANYNGDLTYANGRKGVWRKETTPVGQFPPNAWGLRDMHGNVWEWCEDVWHGGYAGAPTDGSAWLIGGDQSRRVLRGGSWCYGPVILRSAYRDGGSPDDRYGYGGGFRPALDSD